jgi:cytochrome c2
MLRLLLATLVLALCTYPVTAGPLHDAVKKGDVKQVTLIIAAGEDVNEIDHRFGSPLHLAAIWGDADMATLLIAAGADVSAEYRFGQPLYSAARVGNLEVVKILVANGANPNTKGVDGYGAIHAAGRPGQFGIVELLRRLGAISPDIEPITNLLSDADPKAGKKYFGSLKVGIGKCFQCHHVKSGPSSKFGPNLHGIVDRKKAAVDGYKYSPSFGRLEGNWTVEELNAFIASPTDHVPGTRMEITGVADPLMRANLIVYLQGIGDR